MFKVKIMFIRNERTIRKQEKSAEYHCNLYMSRIAI